MTISETHIIDEQYDDNDNLYKIPVYTFLKCNRKAGRGGGVTMFIGESVMWGRRQDLEKDYIESIWIEVFIKNFKRFLVAAYYRPPEGSAYLPKNFNDNFNDMLRDSIKESKEIIILVDFNVNYLKANEHKDFKVLFRLYGFSQMIRKATRITRESSTLIDLITTNNPSMISKYDVFQTSLSDHNIVGSIRKLHHVKYSPKVITCRNYSAYDPNTMNEDFKNVNWQPIYDTSNTYLMCLSSMN